MSNEPTLTAHPANPAATIEHMKTLSHMKALGLDILPGLQAEASRMDILSGLRVEASSSGRSLLAEPPIDETRADEFAAAIESGKATRRRLRVKELAEAEKWSRR